MTLIELSHPICVSVFSIPKDIWLPQGYFKSNMSKTELISYKSSIPPVFHILINGNTLYQNIQAKDTKFTSSPILSLSLSLPLFLPVSSLIH